MPIFVSCLQVIRQTCTTAFYQSHKGKLSNVTHKGGALRTTALDNSKNNKQTKKSRKTKIPQKTLGYNIYNIGNFLPSQQLQ